MRDGADAGSQRSEDEAAVVVDDSHWKKHRAYVPIFSGTPLGG